MNEQHNTAMRYIDDHQQEMLAMWEELVNTDKIIRPAYRCVQPAAGYVSLKDR